MTVTSAASSGLNLQAAVSAVRLEGVSKVFGERGSSITALDRVSIDIAPGEFVCLVGASGCGKTTLLNLIAGIDQPSSGSIDRPGGQASLMFQEPALFPWLTAARNVELALRLRGVGKKARAEEASRLLDLVRLEAFADKRPHQLSGGMRQRVALARALAQHRDILLMDEPFGALDAMTRDVLHEEIERVWQETGITVIFVTHNVREAARLADRVVLLASRPGRVAAAFDIDLPRPRRIESAPVAEKAAEITDRLRQEVSRHVRR